MPKKWLLGKGSQAYIIVRQRDLFPEEQLVLDPNTFSANVEQWISNTLARQTLLDMYQAVGGGRIAAGPTKARGNDLWPMVKRHLERSFKSGELVIVPMHQIVRRIDAPEKPAPVPTKAEQSTQKTWVEIQLLDEEGVPMAKEQYRLKLPDGSFDDGFLDKNGRARVDGIDPGTCQVSFPDLKPNTQPRGAKK